MNRQISNDMSASREQSVIRCKRVSQWRSGETSYNRVPDRVVEIHPIEKKLGGFTNGMSVVHWFPFIFFSSSCRRLRDS